MKIFLLGFMGAGKSYWGNLLAEALHLPYYDLDEIIVEEQGKSIAAIFASEGEPFFREKEKEKLQELAIRHHFVISCGGGTPCFHNNMQLMNNAGLTVWLNPPVETIVERLQRKKHKRPLIRDLDDTELKDFVEAKLAERRRYYELSQLIIDTDHESVDTFVEKLLHA